MLLILLNFNLFCFTNSPFVSKILKPKRKLHVRLTLATKPPKFISFQLHEAHGPRSPVTCIFATPLISTADIFRRNPAVTNLILKELMWKYSHKFLQFSFAKNPSNGYTRHNWRSSDIHFWIECTISHRKSPVLSWFGNLIRHRKDATSFFCSTPKRKRIGAKCCSPTSPHLLHHVVEHYLSKFGGKSLLPSLATTLRTSICLMLFVPYPLCNWKSANPPLQTSPPQPRFIRFAMIYRTDCDSWMLLPPGIPGLGKGSVPSVRFDSSDRFSGRGGCRLHLGFWRNLNFKRFWDSERLMNF